LTKKLFASRFLPQCISNKMQKEAGDILKSICVIRVLNKRLQLRSSNKHAGNADIDTN